MQFYFSPTEQKSITRLLLSTFSYISFSPFSSTVERACDPSRFEPDLALNLEICDVIKEKQKNT